MLEIGERWIGPFQVRALFESCLDETAPKPPESRSAYIVTRREWRSGPTPDSEVLYVGGNTGSSDRFRTRLGDLLADAFGFFTATTGHHSGGQSIHQWCSKNVVNPLDLYIAWIEGAACHRCLEDRLWSELHPVLNVKKPSRCKLHPK